VIAHVDIDGLEPESITVQALHGPIDSEGELLGRPKVVTLMRTADGVWEADYTVGEAGPYGITVRAMPSHPQLERPWGQLCPTFTASGPKNRSVAVAAPAGVRCRPSERIDPSAGSFAAIHWSMRASVI
jgi:hypothetical protein